MPVPAHLLFFIMSGVTAIRMLHSVPGSEDGFTTKLYRKGSELKVEQDISHELAVVFLNSENAEIMPEPESAKTRETKKRPRGRPRKNAVTG